MTSGQQRLLGKMLERSGQRLGHPNLRVSLINAEGQKVHGTVDLVDTEEPAGNVLSGRVEHGLKLGNKFKVSHSADFSIEFTASAQASALFLNSPTTKWIVEELL